MDWVLGVFVELHKGEWGNTPKQHEIKPPGLDFARVVANGT
jgi:hypothetical protein